MKEYYERLYTSINYGITNIELKEIIICEIPKLESNDSNSIGFPLLLIAWNWISVDVDTVPSQKYGHQISKVFLW